MLFIIISLTGSLNKNLVYPCLLGQVVTHAQLGVCGVCVWIHWQIVSKPIWEVRSSGFGQEYKVGGGFILGGLLYKSGVPVELVLCVSNEHTTGAAGY